MQGEREVKGMVTLMNPLIFRGTQIGQNA
jgi:hypothetical protein